MNESAEPFEISLSAVSRHLKVLECAGLISRSREAQVATAQARAKTLQGRQRLALALSALLGVDRMPAYLEELSDGGVNVRPKKKRR